MTSLSENDNYKNDTFTSWEELTNIKKELLRGIYSIGFETPSPIQQKGIIPLINNQDIIAQAQSGTGKTGCFSIGTLQLIDVSENTTQAIIISPTRELSIQTKKVIDTLSVMMNKINTHLLIGGKSIDEDINILNKINPHIIMGCPGRIHDMLRRKKIHPGNVKLLY